MRCLYVASGHLAGILVGFLYALGPLKRVAETVVMCSKLCASIN